MNASQTEKPKRRKFFRRVRRPQVKYVTLLPSVITLLNGIFGFAALSFADRGAQDWNFHQFTISHYTIAAYLIFFGMIADMLDGRVARMSHTTSSFGGQLDSLCDVISFGVAPAFLLLNFLQDTMLVRLEGMEAAISLATRWIWLAAGLFVACAIVRLARFNVENEEDETSHLTFSGLPSPAAAGVICSIVLFYDDMRTTLGSTSSVFRNVETAVVAVLPIIAIAIALLMVSRIRYPHMVNQYFRGKKPVEHLLWVGAIFGLIWLCGLQSALALVFVGFAFSGLVRWMVIRRKTPRIAIAELPKPLVETTGPGQSE
ncbi:MAG: phosphatidylcholine/phosphatidylserine synthase [Phycisphaerae bacterium]|nr:phosphatidylcholine/phosphatidylserine synthase [Phycisphaerae bacterium]